RAVLCGSVRIYAESRTESVDGNRPPIVRLASRRPRQRTIDHVDGVLEPVDRHERAEARAFFLAEQDLVEHVEPVERDARLAVPGLDLAGEVEERLAPAHLLHPVPDLLRRGIRGQVPE